MLRTALRNVLAHKARLLMTVLAVMLGVAFVSGTLVFTDTLGNAFRKQSAKGFEKIAVQVESPTVGEGDTETGLPAGTLAKIQGLPQVAEATGRVTGFAGVADQKGKLIGNGWSNTGSNFAPGKDGKDPSYDFTEGNGPASAGEIALDKETAKKGKYKVGDTIRVATSGPVVEYTLAGVFTTDLGSVSAGGSMVLFDTAVAQKQYLKPDHFSTFTVTAKGTASDEQVLAAVKPLLPADADAETGTKLADDEADMIKREMSGLSTMLLAFAGIALFVGIFLIANTFTMLVAQRTRELALMRAVGASRRQVKRSVILEAGVVGILASVVGFGLGLGLAVGLRSLIGSIGAKIPNGPLVISPTAVLSALTVGVVVTVLAAWLPARRAAKIPPVAAMSSVHAVASAKSLLIRNIIGSILTAGGLALIAAGAGSSDGTSGRILIAVGAFFALIGVIVLIPQLSHPLIAMVRPLMVRAFGVSGKLAAQNAVRNPRRTGATASALAIGLTLVTGLTVIGVTVGQAIDKMTTDNIRADYLVSMSSGTSMDVSAVDALSKAKGVEGFSRKQIGTAEVKGSEQMITGVDPAGFDKVFSVKAVSGSLNTLAQGQIVIEEKTAKKKNWKAGDQLPLVFERDGKKTTKTLTVGAVIAENELFSSYVVDQKLLDPFEEKPYLPEVWVKMAGGETKANEQALVDSLGNNPAMTVMDKQDIRNFFGGMINTMLNIMYGLLAMALVIAVLGVVNTLAMSVFERQQEIGMLRAIGLDRRRVKRMIRLEAVVISVFGAVVGVGLGSFLGWAIGETFRDSIPNYELVIPYGRIGVFLLLAGVVGVLASLWPARSAAKLNMLTAIKTE
ncbi:ABC transporter permease [Streptomyces qinzhouensis]|uniref:FtsX-like permease family protein n=1 Tax=Streptomyces qinzhouensis TaxID=2599401 RepID=A0A5B8IIC7_9ACTN|nr:FtsX-like permease family protein [Streptomyces qinzhouensis]QDY77129.1 FtsX-like permease family protein [Streptomyces qinzhouensis]